MPDPFLLLALALMVLAVAGSVAPLVPGALLSVAGVLVYWWSTGYTAPGPAFLAAFVAVGLLAVLADHLSGVIAAKYGGASTRNSVAGGIVGLLLFVVTGPVGLLLGVAGTVLVLEFLAHRDRERSLKAAAYAAVGVVGAGVVQFVVTLSLLAAFVVAVLA